MLLSLMQILSYVLHWKGLEKINNLFIGKCQVCFFSAFPATKREEMDCLFVCLQYFWRSCELQENHSWTNYWKALLFWWIFSNNADSTLLNLTQLNSGVRLKRTFELQASIITTVKTVNPRYVSWQKDL